MRVLHKLFSILLLSSLVLIFITLPISLYLFFLANLSKNYTPYNTSESIRMFLFSFEYRIPIKLPFWLTFMIFWLLNLLMIKLTFSKNPFISDSLTLKILDYFVFTYFTIVVLRAIISMFVSLGEIHPQDYFIALIQSVLAPIREEFGYRLTIIGIPLAIIMYRRVKKQIHKLLWKPYDYIPDSRGYKLIAFALISCSSILFGLAHLKSYEPIFYFRMLEATVSGFILGYSYFKEGFHASISLHIFFNYSTFYSYIIELDLIKILLSYLLFIAGLISFYKRCDNLISRVFC